MKKNLFIPYADNKGAHQAGHLHSLIISFVVHCLDSTIPLVHLSAGRCSLIGCATAWYVDSPRFDPHVRKYSFMEFGHEILSTAILSLPLIQEGHLSVTGKRMCSKYW